MRPFLYISILFLFSSCATLYTGNKSVIHFSTSPQNAEVRINDKIVGVTPLTLRIKRSIIKKKVTLHKTGYATKTIELKRKFKLISLLSNVAIFVDVATGAIIDYPNHFIQTNLKLKDTSKVIATSYNLEDNFYLISREDTFYTTPFQELHLKSFLSDKIDKINFKLLDGTEMSIPSEDVIKYKRLEIYHIGIGALYLYCQIKVDFKIKEYIPVFFSERKQKKKFMFMEELLFNKEFHLVKSYVNVVSANAITQGVSMNSKPVFYLYRDGEVIKPIKQKELLKMVELNFSNYKDLIVMLNKRNKFKTLEAYVYNDK